MSPALLGAFVGATAVPTPIPGPNVALIVTGDFGFGPRAIPGSGWLRNRRTGAIRIGAALGLALAKRT
jgi:hypothetical protein